MRKNYPIRSTEDDWVIFVLGDAGEGRAKKRAKWTRGSRRLKRREGIGSRSEIMQASSSRGAWAGLRGSVFREAFPILWRAAYGEGGRGRKFFSSEKMRGVRAKEN